MRPKQHHIFKLCMRLFVLCVFSLMLEMNCDNSSNSTKKSEASIDTKSWIDVHGAGAQRSDPKEGNPADFPEGRGPQGDAIRIYNYVRLVRGNSSSSNNYPVVDTGQTDCYDTSVKLNQAPAAGELFYGQDAQFSGLQPSYTDNGDGTVTDNVTELMWVKDHGTKMSYDDAVFGASSCDAGGYTDWRLPSIKELYSLILFAGTDPSGFINSPSEGNETKLIPFIDTYYFTFKWGDTSAGERIIDAQYISSTEYVGTKDTIIPTVFGVNFADGRIKAYPKSTVLGNWKMTFYVKYVRGSTQYGINNFADNGDGTVSDNATGLIWDQDDSGTGLDWQEALALVQTKNTENYKGHSDWRLPNAKELQSIVDYTRSPETTSSPAIDPVFRSTAITDEAGNQDYAFYWTGTTHQGMNTSYEILGNAAVYIAFGEALGCMSLSTIEDGPPSDMGGPSSRSDGPPQQ